MSKLTDAVTQMMKMLGDLQAKNLQNCDVPCDNSSVPDITPNINFHTPSEPTYTSNPLTDEEDCIITTEAIDEPPAVQSFEQAQTHLAKRGITIGEVFFQYFDDNIEDSYKLAASDVGHLNKTETANYFNRRRQIMYKVST